MIVTEEPGSTRRKTCYADTVRDKSHMDWPVDQFGPSHSAATGHTKT